MADAFHLTTNFEPKGDQPQAIEELMQGLVRQERHQVLLGITGSGKTFTIANVIQRYGRPALILAPNKTLAAQLYGEMRELSPISCWKARVQRIITLRSFGPACRKVPSISGTSLTSRSS